MMIPEGVRQLGMKLKRDLENSVDKDSIETILETEAKKAKHQPKPKAAKEISHAILPSPSEKGEDGPAPKPELDQIVIKPACPVTYGLDVIDARPFGNTAPKDVARKDLIKFCLPIIETEGPHSTDQLLDRAFGLEYLSDGDLRAMRQRLPKWLVAECRDRQPPLTMKRWRDSENGEKRHRLFGFWPTDVEKTRSDFEKGELLRAIAKLHEDIAIIRQVQSEVLQRQDNLRSGLAAMLEKLTWNGEL